MKGASGAAIRSRPIFRSRREAPIDMLYAGIDIHKKVFQAVVFDPDSAEVFECRFEPSRERLGEWASEWEGRLAGVAIEATTG